MLDLVETMIHTNLVQPIEQAARSSVEESKDASGVVSSEKCTAPRPSKVSAFFSAQRSGQSCGRGGGEAAAVQYRYGLRYALTDIYTSQLRADACAATCACIHFVCFSYFICVTLVGAFTCLCLYLCLCVCLR
jgi:hypothetical protein